MTCGPKKRIKVRVGRTTHLSNEMLILARELYVCFAEIGPYSSFAFPDYDVVLAHVAGGWRCQLIPILRGHLQLLWPQAYLSSWHCTFP